MSAPLLADPFPRCASSMLQPRALVTAYRPDKALRTLTKWAYRGCG